ncbi:hypothetical protein FGG08_003733 [Glutinoglossum americanum]|uniref:Uncharacterized protein n=1 Tax=Glutinoglossum americanum TaxID=1670608 RepID=A0A9P8ICT1_9PEZI|nr:hypothetical protein FGG08_003733 [Glutinoglossum americanum]
MSGCANKVAAPNKVAAQIKVAARNKVAAPNGKVDIPGPLRSVLGACGDFINVEHGLANPIHFSIKELLTRLEDDWLSNGEDQEIVQFQVYVAASHRAMSSSYPLHGTDAFPQSNAYYQFLKYASRYAINHLSQSWPPCSAIRGNVRKFLTSEKYVTWIEYATMLSLKNGGVAVVERWFDMLDRQPGQGDMSESVLGKGLGLRLNQELVKRVQMFGEHDPRREQWYC